MNIEYYVVHQLKKEYKRQKASKKNKAEALTFVWVGQEERIFPKIPKTFVGVQLKKLSNQGLIKLFMVDLTLQPEFFNWIRLMWREEIRYWIPIVLDSVLSIAALIISIIALIYDLTT